MSTQQVIPTSGRSPHRGGGAPSIECRFNTVDAANPLGSAGAAVGSPHDLPVGTQVWRSCFDTATGARVSGPALIPTTAGVPTRPAVTQQLIDSALANLDVDLPTVQLAPPTATVPNFDTWFRVEAANRQRASAAAGGVTVTVTAEIVRTTFTINPAADPTLASADDGRQIRCNRPTAAFPTAVPAGRAATSPCAHRFTTPTRDLTVDATTVWSLAWTATNGTSGDLGTIDRSTTLAYRVQAESTVIRHP